MAEQRLEVDIIANDRASRPIKNLQSTIIRFVGAVSASLAALSAVVFPIASAKEFDRVLRDIQKTTGFTNEEIKVLSGELLTLSTRLDTSANDLGKIAAAAGQLGLGEEGGQAILQFTESIARASTTLDLTAEKAATSFAKIASIFGIPIENTENLISTINELSNTTTATADQLLDVVSRVGTVAGSFEDAAALAAQAIQLGLSPETAGTSIVKIFSNFESKADQFASEFGITVGDFLGKGAIERWQFYLGELGKLSDDEAARIINKLSGSGRIFALVDKQVQDAANGYAIFNKAQQNAETAFVEGTSALEEYANVSQSLEVQLGILRNNFAAIATQIGLRVVPRLIEITQRLVEFLQSSRAQAFFNQISQGFSLVISGIESFIDALTTLSGGSLANVFSILFGGAVIRIGIAFIRFLDSVIARLLTLGQAARQTTTVALGERITRGLLPALTNLGRALDNQKGKLDVTQSELGQTAASYQAAGAAALRYADATKTAALSQAGIATTAQQASQRLANDRGAQAFSAVPGQGAAQIRVDTIQRELVLQEQRRQAAIKAGEAARKETAELLRRVGVIKRADAAELAARGKISSISAGLQADLQKEIAAQKVILTQAQQRAVRLTSSTFQLQQQLTLWKGIQSTRQQAALTGLAGPGNAQIVALTRTQKATQAVGEATRRVGAAAGAAAKSGFGLTKIWQGLVPILGRLAVGLRTIIGLLGGPLGIAITAAIFFWDEIKGAITAVAEALGFVSEQEAVLTETLQKEAARQQAIINRRIADWKRLQSAIKAGTQIETGEGETDPIGAQTFEETGRAVADTTGRLTDYSNAIFGAEQQIISLQQQQERVIGQLTTTATAIKEATDAGEDIRTLQERYEELGKTWDELDQQISRVEATTVELGKGLRRAATELGEQFTTVLSEAVDARAAFVNISEEIARVEQDLEDISDIPISPKIITEASDVDLETLKQQLLQIFGEDIDLTLDGGALYNEVLAVSDEYKRRLEALQLTSNDLERDSKAAVAALSPSEEQLFQAAEINKLNQEELAVVQEALNIEQDRLDEETDRTRALRANAKEILSQNFAYEAQLGALKEQEEALKANKAAAQGIFDNTIRESQALVRSLNDVNRAIDDVLETRVQQRNVDRNISTINQNIEDRTARIAELEETIANTTDAYVRNKARAEISELNALNTLDASARRQAERRSAQIRLNQLASQQAELFREVQAAAAAGQTANFQAIKNQLDNSIKESGNIVADLAGLQDEEGNFLFREDEIESLRFALNQGAQQYTDAIPNLNKTLLEAATTQEQALADSIKEFTTANKDVVQEYQDLIKEFPAIAKNIDLAREEWAKVNAPLIAAIDSFADSTQQALIQGQGLGEGFGDRFGDIQEQALDTLDAGRLIDDDEFSQIVENGLDGVDTQAWIDKIQEASKEGSQAGVNSITVNDLGEYTNAVREATRTGLAEALLAIGIQREGLGAEGVAGAGNTETAEEAATRTQAQIDAIKSVPPPVLTGQEADPDALTTQGVKDAFTAALREQFGPPNQPTEPVDEDPGFIDRLRTALRANPLLPGFARGGGVAGPGTSTSDSITARLSKGEYVNDAATVRGMGGFGFFDMLKRIAGSSGSTASRFASGLPRYRDGGPVLGSMGNMATVNLTLPGAGTFPVVAETDVVGKMTRAIKRETLRRGTKSR